MNYEEAEVLACRKTLEFAMESGLTKMILEGDNVAVMKAVASTSGDLRCCWDMCMRNSNAAFMVLLI